MAATNTRGEFAFAARPDVPYVVELADVPGRVIAVSDVVVAQAAGMGVTVIALPQPLSPDR